MLRTKLKTRIPSFLRLSNLKIAFGISCLFALVILVTTGLDEEDEVLRFFGLGKIFRDFEYRVFDQKFLWRGPKVPPSQVALVAIDEKSVASIGRWPWPRTKIAELIEKLDALGAKAIALDIVFSEPDQLGVYGLLSDMVERLDQIPKINPELETVKAELISIQGQWQLLVSSSEISADQKEKISKLNSLQGKAVDQLLEELSKQKDREGSLEGFVTFVREERERVNADRILAETIQKAGNVVLGYYFLKPGEIEGLPKEKYEDFSTLENSKLSAFHNTSDPERAVQNLKTIQYVGVGANIVQIAGEHSQQGFFNTEADSDNIYRRTPLLVSIRGSLYPSLSLLAVQSFYREQDGEDVIVPSFSKGGTGLESIRLTQGIVKADPTGKVFFNWYGPKGTIATHSVLDVLEGTLEKEKIQDKVILIGSTALAIADLRSAPVGEDFPGVEMQATVVGNILENNYLVRPGWLYVLEIVLMVVGGSLFGWFVGRLRPNVGFLFMFLVLGILAVFDFYLMFLKLNVWFRPVMPAFGLIAVYTGVTLRGFISEEIAKRQVKKTFDAYVNPSVVDQMLASPDKFRLGGERKELTVFFSDIRGFTGMSEKLDPEELVSFLNEYLTPMTDIVFQYDGTVDKYIGDAIMGFWGAPLPQLDHAERACHSALDMVSRLKELQEEWKRKELPIIEMGIGINTGHMAVGNMGSKSRFNYTVMGDEVNLASRLEGLCKEYGTQIVLGSKTAKKVRKQFIVRPLDRVRVKGKASSEEIFELMGRRDSLKLEEREHERLLINIAEQFTQALEAFWKQDWNHAEDLFQKVIELRQGDKSSRIFLDQIEHFRAQVPDRNWDGVRVMTTK